MKTTLEQELAAAVAPIMERIRNEDAVTRFREAGELNEAVKAVVSMPASKLRRHSVRELRGSGWTLKEIAQEMGLTTGRIAQIEFGYDRTERKRRAAQ